MTQAIGVILIFVNVICAFSVFAQIRLTYHRKNDVGVSWVPYTMGLTNALVGLVYSFLISDPPFIVANLAWASVNGIMVLLLLIYRHAAKPTTGVETE
ncbi:MAG: hypothetical protein HY741_01775 [Chloroflexi bacterium]|nr:hypothetical protein [Chloroflexota bacterium]